VELNFKQISRKEDQAGSLIWQAKDSKTTTSARQCSGKRVTIGHTINSRRTEKKWTVTSNQWHTLRVNFDPITSVALDGKNDVDWDD
jgi:hypothetical protein